MQPNHSHCPQLQTGKRRSASLTVVAFAILCLLFTACGTKTTQIPSPGQPTLTSTPPAAPSTATTVPTPTQTPEPLALRVNGEGIALVEYNADLKQLQEADQSLGKNTTPEQQRQQVLDNFTATLLLAQGAAADGFTLDDAGLKAEMDRLAGEMGSEQALTDWMNKYGYTPAAFQVSLRRQMAAAWERDHLAAQVPQDAEQIHARQILTQDEDLAKRALDQVKLPGVNFAAQALRYDPETGGDLGWFPRGYLLQPEVETAVFALQPGEISGVVKSQVGYHIIQVIAREQSRPLSPDARRVLQHKAIQDWVNKQREASKVEVLLP